jgi:hypothetical protein
MSRSNEYRRFAAKCVKIARACEDEQRQAIFLKMAQVWLDLARRDETDLKSGEVDREDEHN